VKLMCLKKLSKIFFLFVFAFAIQFLYTSTAFAAVTETWGESTGKDGELSEFYRATGNVAAISEGTGLSNPRSGTITISGIPADATVKRAWLYYGGYAVNVTPTKLSKVNFQGQEISLTSTPAALQIGQFSMREDGTRERRTYRAEVTDLISGNGEGTYSLSVTSHTKKDTFGASLVIIYEDPAIENGTVVINDGVVMISKKYPTNVQGPEYSSTIDGLSLSNPPNGQLTLMISEGTAVDSTDLVFTGSTNHTFGDFTSNTDGKVWDDRRIDVASYLDSDTTSITADLRDQDDGGWYAHYYFMMFQTNKLEGDLAESTLSITNSQPNPLDLVTMDVTVRNDGSSVAKDTVFQMDLPGSVSFVSNTIEVDDSLKTDSNGDADGAYYVDLQKKVYIELGDVSAGGQKTVKFDLRMNDGLDHNTQIPIQGRITSESQSVLTDGDGTQDDGIDGPTWLTIYGGMLTGVPSGIEATLRDQPSFDPRVSRKTGVHYVRFRKDGRIIADIPLDMNDDVSVDIISADVDNTNRKAYFHGFESLPSDVKGGDGYTLSIPYLSGDTEVRICSGAQSLDEVYDGCIAEPNVTSEFVVVDGQTVNGVTCNVIAGRWLCSGLTGSGGQGEGEGEGGGGGGAPEFSTYMLFATVLGCFYFMRKELGQAFVVVLSRVRRWVPVYLVLLIQFFSLK
jgi:uncharacterized repeat protein (TIGR01451 family)